MPNESSWTTPRRYQTLEGERLNLAAIAEDFHITPRAFYEANRRGCPSWKGRSLIAVTMCFGTGLGQDESTYLKSQVATVLASPMSPLAERIAEWKQGIYKKHDKPHFTPAALERKGIGSRRLEKLLAEGRLVAEKFPRRHGGAKQSNSREGNKIVAYRFTQADDDGTSDRPSFDGKYERADGKEALNIKASAEWMLLHGCPCHENTLRSYLRDNGCEYLPEGKLPSQSRQRPDYDYQEPTILVEDLEKLRDAMLSAQKSGRLGGCDDGRRTDKELGALFHLPKKYWWTFGVFLCRLVESGQLERDRTRRFSKKKKRYYKPWGYRPEDVQRLLSGHDLGQLLNKARPYLYLRRAKPRDFPDLGKFLSSEPQPTANETASVPIVPRWDDEAVTLYWGETPIREFRNAAKNQRDIVEAFHRANWDRTIPDPLKNPRKLNVTISDLNRSLDPKLVRFRGDGTGDGIMWEPAE
jgi:hypothetical protein